MTIPLSVRFWRHVEKSDGCWLWTGCKDKRGYGRIAKGGATCYPLLAPRVSWELANSCVVPDGLQVMHSCDNPPCVNPAHLSIGTHKDNMRDAASKGRMHKTGVQGSAHHKAKLTDDDVRAIRVVYDTQRQGRKHLPNGVVAALVARLGVGKDVICGIGARKTWTHV